MIDDPELRKQIAEIAAAQIARDMRCIVPDRVYNPDDAAELMGLTSKRGGKTLKEIPHAMLPLIPITPGGRIVGYMGRDMLKYLDERRGVNVRTLKAVG